MHPNPAFRQNPADQNLALARQVGFGVLTINGPDGPLASHIPFHLSPDGMSADLHLARSNPIARAAGANPALLAVQGPQHYISPDWYGPHDQVPDQVPTWNYIAVHLRGTLHPLPGDDLEPHLDALTAEHEQRLLPKTPWTKAKMTPEAMPRMMRMILPFRLRITDVQGTWKLNQNKAPDIRARAAAALSAQTGLPQAHQIAKLMHRDLG
ncbi:FMN-binding negative transcriptional regulator [Pseudotabrizicola sp. L79]|uniref:FMN-binding negative transcriptional regulator n=1 Tax=Pseudotabrizicola sp. L79 TaxID=3118402 RepID=UPI002F938370